MRPFITTVITIAFIIVASIFSVSLWAGKEEFIVEDVRLSISADMTIAQFGEANSLSKKLLGKVFNLDAPSQIQKPVSAFDMSLEQIEEKVNKEIALEAEDSTKNWLKIPLKFTLWFLFMIICFQLLFKKKLTNKTRLILYGVGFTLFGIVLGADPSPMGTVKDAIILYASKGVIYKPRIIAFIIFTLTVVLANKFICSWGCQIGTLQDFIFRLNRKKNDTERGDLPQFKIPFIVSNSIRILFFIALVLVAFSWTYDITNEINPFIIFKPLNMSVLGWIFVVVLLITSLFVYRPWCHLFCPFGLTGWLFEKISLYRIRVDYDACISCNACANACPSSVMGAILKRDKAVIPDCFSCGSCIESCPTNAVSFSFGKRAKPPLEKISALHGSDLDQ